MLTRWDKFARTHLDPPPPRSVGRKLIESGELEGVANLNGWPWVDAAAFQRRAAAKTIDEQALELLA